MLLSKNDGYESHLEHHVTSPNWTYAMMQIVLYPQLHHTKGYMPEYDS